MDKLLRLLGIGPDALATIAQQGKDWLLDALVSVDPLPPEFVTKYTAAGYAPEAIRQLWGDVLSAAKLVPINPPSSLDELQPRHLTVISGGAGQLPPGQAEGEAP